METEQKTCAQRIDDEYRNRNITLEEFYEKLESDDDEERAEGYALLGDFPLEITEYKVVKILLSTGGPADWIEVRLNEEDNNYILGMSYHFQDWFDHAEKKIDSDSYLWEYASQILDQR